jgi:hypothetical protein
MSTIVFEQVADFPKHMLSEIPGLRCEPKNGCSTSNSRCSKFVAKKVLEDRIIRQKILEFAEQKGLAFEDGNKSGYYYLKSDSKIVFLVYVENQTEDADRKLKITFNHYNDV